MATHFQQDQSEQDAYTSLELTEDKDNGKNNLISQAAHCDKLKYAILLALACLSAALFVVILVMQPTDRINSEPTSSLQPPGDVYSGGEDDFTCLENTYTTEGIVGTPNSQQLTGISGYRECYDRCRRVYGYSCNFFSFHDGTGICSISSADFYSTWTLTEQMDGAFSCYRYKYKSDQWKMMYRRPKETKSGYTNEVTGPWFDNSYYTNESLPSAAAALPDGVSWSILKNPLGRYWESLNIDKVKVSLYKDGKEVHHLIFNGRGSNTESWFNYTFLLETTWNDLGPGNPPPMYLGWWWADPLVLFVFIALVTFISLTVYTVRPLFWSISWLSFCLLLLYPCCIQYLAVDNWGTTSCRITKPLLKDMSNGCIIIIAKYILKRYQRLFEK